MLEYLRIRNLALIEDMELEFSSGMNVLTGETGAGKSFILKALGFLLGDKLSADMVRAGAERAQVEALFSTAEADMVLRREIVAETGRSRLYINDELRSQDSLRDLRNRLVAHTSQHAQQKLLQSAFQARLLESGISCPELLTQRDDLLSLGTELFAAVSSGQVRIEVNQTYALADAASAHRDLEARKTTGSTILLP